MKKILYGIFVFLLAFVLVGCQPTDEDKLQGYLSKIEAPASEVTENFLLQSSIDNGTDHSISWESSNKDIIRIGNLADKDGVNYYTANVTRGAEDVEVELTATVELINGLSAQKTFRVKVIKAEKEEVKYITVAEALENKLNAIVTVKGVVSGFHYGTYQEQPSIQGCYLTDDTGTIYVYGYVLAQSVEKGDEIIIEATVADYKTYKQLSTPTLVETVSKGNQISSKGAVADKTVAQIAADLESDYTGAAYIFSNVHIKKVDGGSYISYSVEDKEGNSVNLYSSGDSSEFAWLDQYADKEVKVLFAINSQNSKGTKWRGHVLDVLEVIGDWSGTTNPGGGNQGGNTNGNENLVLENDYLKEVQVGVAYKIAIDQKNVGSKFVFTGTMSGYYGATSEKASEGVDVYLEETTGGYNLYFMQGETKKYIVITKNDTHYNFTIADKASSVWVFDTTNYTLTTDVEGTTIYMGTYGTYKTFGGSSIDKIESSYPARFYLTTTSEGGGSTGGGTTVEPGTLLSVKDAVGCAIGNSISIKGIVSGFHYGEYQNAQSVQGFYVTDLTGTIYVYGFQVAQSVQKGDEIEITATVSEYKGYKQLDKPTLVNTLSTGNDIPTEGAITDKSVADIAGDLSTNYASAAYIFTGVQIVKVDGGSYINYVMEDMNGNAINLYSSSNSSEFAWLDQYAGKELKVLFAINSQNSKGTKWRGHVLEVLEIIGDWSGTTNPGGGNQGGNTDTPVVNADYVKEVQVGVAYKFAINQTSKGELYFFIGTMSGYYGATSTSASDAVNVYLEEANGGYNLYFMQGETKKYIVITKNDTHYNFTIADKASSVWVFDTTNYTLTTDVEGTTIYMGTYGNYSTFGGSSIDKIGSSYPARLYPENTTGTTNPGGTTGGGSQTGQSPAGTLPELVIENKVITGGAYVTNNEEYPNPSFYSNGGLKINYVNMGVITNTFDSQDKLFITITINALNANQKTESSTEIDALTIYGLNAAGEVVATASTNNVVEGDINVSLEGTGIVQVKVLMTDYYNDGTTCYNINLGGVKVSK